MDFNQNPLSAEYPDVTYHGCVSVVRKLLNGSSSFRLQDLDDFAAETANRFWLASLARRIEHPWSFLYGVAKNVIRETIRQRQRDHSLNLDFLDVPDIPPASDEDLPLLQDEFLWRLQNEASPRELTVLPYLYDAGKHKNSENAAKLAMSSRAFTVAKNRLKKRATLLHARMVAETFPFPGDVPTLEQRSRLLALARTPRERADFRIRLVLCCQTAAFERRSVHTMHGLSEVSYLHFFPLIKNEKPGLVHRDVLFPMLYHPSTTLGLPNTCPGDLEFIATVLFAWYRLRLLYWSPSCDDEFFSWCKNVRDCAYYSLLMGNDRPALSILKGVKEVVKSWSYRFSAHSLKSAIEILAQTIPFFDPTEQRQQASDFFRNFSDYARRRWNEW